MPAAAFGSTYRCLQPIRTLNESKTELLTISKTELPAYEALPEVEESPLCSTHSLKRVYLIPLASCIW